MLDLLVSMSNRIAVSTAVEPVYEYNGQLDVVQCRCCTEEMYLPAEMDPILCEDCEALGEEMHR